MIFSRCFMCFALGRHLGQAILLQNVSNKRSSQIGWRIRNSASNKLKSWIHSHRLREEIDRIFPILNRSSKRIRKVKDRTDKVQRFPSSKCSKCSKCSHLCSENMQIYLNNCISCHRSRQVDRASKFLRGSCTIRRRTQANSFSHKVSRTCRELIMLLRLWDQAMQVKNRRFNIFIHHLDQIRWYCK